MSIRWRLLVFFALVIGAGGLMTFMLVRRAAETQLRSYAFTGDAEKAKVYAGILAEYYAEHMAGWVVPRSLPEVSATMWPSPSATAIRSDRRALIVEKVWAAAGEKLASPLIFSSSLAKT